MTTSSRMQIDAFFDPATWTLSYLLSDVSTGDCAIIDSVLDYDPKSGRTTTTSAEKLAACIRERGLRLLWLIETHVHADHLSAAAYLKQMLGGAVVVGQHITAIQDVFGRLFNAGTGFRRDGSQFDKLVVDNEQFALGNLTVTCLHTPGHTPACMSFLVSGGEETAVFVGDTLFMPDYGTARCDFPGGDPRSLYRSIQRLYSLPPETRLFMCHDYLPGGREMRYLSTVAEQRASNVHLNARTGEDEFVAMRRQRDATLDMPMLILPSVQVNMRAGQFPEPESNGISYLKIPLNAT